MMWRLGVMEPLKGGDLQLIYEDDDDDRRHLQFSILILTFKKSSYLWLNMRTFPLNFTHTYTIEGKSDHFES